MRRGSWLVLLLASAVAVACRQVAGITDAPPEKLTSSVCGLPYGSPSCAQCVQKSCCAESDTCAGDPSCEAYQSCFGACAGDPACWSKCIIDHPATGMDVSALSACMASHCEDACDLRCGGFAGRPFPPTTAAACQSCLAQNSCDTTRACATSAACDTALRCINAAPTYDLVDRCLEADNVDPSWGWAPDAGSSALTQVFRAAQSCGTRCSGADWHCVGHVNWPDLPSVKVPYTLNLFVRDYSTSTAESGVLVQLCGFTDLDCAMPVAHGTTDADGNVSLSFDNTTTGGGVSGLTGFLKLTRSDLLTSYVYWGYPLSGSGLSLLTEMVTKSLNATLIQSLGVTPDAARGNVTVATYDCQCGVAPGVPVAIDSADGETTSFDSSSTPSTTTDSSGLIFFENVPAGPAQITATPVGLTRPASTVKVNVRTDGQTVVYAYPTP